MAREKILYTGHPVAAVASTSPSIAAAALKLIEVDYEVLPHVIDVEAAVAEDAPIEEPVVEDTPAEEPAAEESPTEETSSEEEAASDSEEEKKE